MNGDVKTVADAPVEFVGVTYDAPKELHEACEALLGLVADVKAKKDPATILGGNLKKFSDAVDKFDRIPGEARQALGAFSERSGHFGGQIVGVLLK